MLVGYLKEEKKLEAGKWEVGTKASTLKSPLMGDAFQHLILYDFITFLFFPLGGMCTSLSNWLLLMGSFTKVGQYKCFIYIAPMVCVLIKNR